MSKENTAIIYKAISIGNFQEYAKLVVEKKNPGRITKEREKIAQSNTKGIAERNF